MGAQFLSRCLGAGTFSGYIGVVFFVLFVCFCICIFYYMKNKGVIKMTIKHTSHVW